MACVCVCVYTVASLKQVNAILNNELQTLSP